MKLLLTLVLFASLDVSHAQNFSCEKVFDSGPFMGQWEMIPTDKCPSVLPLNLTIDEKVMSYYNDTIFVNSSCTIKGLDIQYPRDPNNQLFPAYGLSYITHKKTSALVACGGDGYGPDYEELTTKKGFVKLVTFENSNLDHFGRCLSRPLVYGNKETYVLKSDGKVLTVGHESYSRFSPEDDADTRFVECKFKRIN